MIVIDLTDDEKILARASAFEAIKAVRTRVGCSILQAKESVDAFRAGRDDPVTVLTAEEISLRDWFAGEYDSSRVSFPDTETMAKYVDEKDIPNPADWLAILALARRAESKLRYDYADAMLAEREKAGALKEVEE